MYKLTYNRLLAFDKHGEKSFFTEIHKGVNIIYGRNTSGKSTLIQLLVYAMGINDAKENLNEILEYGITVRLDCTLECGSETKNISFIRDGSSLVVKEDECLPKRFDGIDGNSSFEYREYKKYFNSLINFDLKLESRGEIGLAPIEAAFLPFYISQSVGWVYLRESIGNYRYYKNFKEDYLDYYVGLTNNFDRDKLINLKEEKQQHTNGLNIIQRYEYSHPEIMIAKEINDKFKDGAMEYINEFNILNSDLISSQQKHLELSNKKTMLLMRLNTLGKVKRAQNRQRPSVDNCPVCEQLLPGTINSYYKHKQEINDTDAQKASISIKIKENQSSLNSEENKLSEYKRLLVSKYKSLHRLKLSDVTFDAWLDYETKFLLAKKLGEDREQLNKKLKRVNDDIADLKIDEDLELSRRKAGRKFLGIFKKKAASLSVDIPKDDRYRYLYDISSFPMQGVELHKIIMAYHSAFRDFVSEVKGMHKLPFVLDAVFKEDIDEKSRDLIYKFLAEQVDDNEQFIFSVADYKDPDKESDKESDGSNALNSWIESMNVKYFASSGNLICIGDAIHQKSFLNGRPNPSEKILIEETIALSEVY